MEKTLHKIQAYLPGALVSVLLIWSLFDPLGNKFDVGRSIFLTLGFAAVSVFLMSFTACHPERSEGSLAFLWKKIFGKLQDDIVESRMSISSVFLFLFFLFSLISFFKSQTANFGFTEILMLGSVILLFWSSSQWSKMSWQFLYRFTVLLAIFTSLWGYILYFVSHHNRLFGLFYNSNIQTDAWPNAMALFSLLTLPVVFHFCFFAQNKTDKKSILVFKVLGMSLVLASFFLTFSRAAMIAFVGQVLLLVIYLLWSGILRQNLSKIFLVIIISFALVQVGQVTRSYFQENVIAFEQRAGFENGQELTSIQERKDFWQGTIEMTKNKPLFGYGPMSFSYVYRSIQAHWLAIADHPHNWFLKLSAERGLLACFSFVFFLFILLVKSFQSLPKLDKEKQFILVVLLISTLGALAHNLVDFNFNFATNYLLFWLFLAAISHLTCSNKKSMFHNILSKKLCVLTVFVMVLILFAYELRMAAYGKLAGQALDRGDLELSDQYFDIYQQTMFPRYFFWEQADRMVAREDYDSARYYYVKHEELNPWDARNQYRLGILLYDHFDFERDWGTHTDFFKRAIELDPMNYWQYYSALFETWEDVFLDKDLQDQLVANIQSYLPVVEKNLHYDAQHDNPYYLLKVLDFLMEYDAENRQEYLQYQQQIEGAIDKWNR